MWYEHLLHFLHLGESPSTVMQKRKKTLLLSDVRVSARIGPEASTICTNSSYVTAFVSQ